MIELEHKLIREERKTLSIHVMPDMSIMVKAPIEALDSEISSFIKRKHVWTVKQLGYFSQFQTNAVNDGIYTSGTELYYLGKQYQLIIEQCDNESVTLDKTKLIIRSKKSTIHEHNYNMLNSWLRDKTIKEFNLALKRCLKMFDIPTPTLKIRKLSRRWGSHLKPNTIVLNPALIAVPKKCIEYVIVHELCHYYHKNHSSEFFALLGVKLPNWTRLKNALEKYYNITKRDLNATKII